MRLGSAAVVAHPVPEESRSRPPTANRDLTQLRTFTTFRTVEDYPCQQVFREVFKTMHLACGGKKRVTRTELNTPAFDKKPAAPSSDDIKFVAGVRLLQISALGRVNLDCQSAVAEEFGIEFTFARGYGILRNGKCDDAFQQRIPFLCRLLKGALLSIAILTAPSC